MSSGGLCLLSSVLWRSVHIQWCPLHGGLCILSGVLWRSVHTQWCPLKVCAYSVVSSGGLCILSGGLCIPSGVLWRSVYTQWCLLEVCAYSAVSFGGLCIPIVKSSGDLCTTSDVLWRSVHIQRCRLEGPLLYPLYYMDIHTVIFSEFLLVYIYTSLYTIIILRRYMHKWRDVIESKRS